MSNPVPTIETLRRGMEGPAVDTLQDQLIEFGYMTLAQKNTKPGRFGPITENAVTSFQRDNLIDANGTRDAATQGLLQQLQNGVRLDSEGGVVLPMQKRLVKTGNLRAEDLTAESGKIGQATEEALRDFQADHAIEQSGELSAETYRALKVVSLVASVPGAVDVQLPEQGEGFRTFLREGGATQFGTEKAITALTDLARAWAQKHPEVPIQFGHISRKGGGPFISTVNPGTLAHQTHKDGRTVDIRPIRKDNAMQGVDVRTADYDRARTKELVEMLRERHPGVDIICNDEKFTTAGLTRFFKGHFDHLHVHLPK